MDSGTEKKGDLTFSRGKEMREEEHVAGTPFQMEDGI
jgi:hypothetical protein